MWLWTNSHKYIQNTIFKEMNIHQSQLFGPGGSS